MFVHIHTHAHTYILYAHKRAKVQTHSNTEISSRSSEALSLTHSILLLYPLLLEYTGVLTMWHTKLIMLFMSPLCLSFFLSLLRCFGAAFCRLPPQWRRQAWRFDAPISPAPSNRGRLKSAASCPYTPTPLGAQVCPCPAPPPATWADPVSQPKTKSRPKRGVR